MLADVNDRLSGQTQQVTNSVSWSKDIFEMRLRQDSLRLQVGAQLDSLERSFNRIVVVAEHLPEISDKVLEELNRQATQLIWTMNASVDNAFADFDRQRGELQQYVTREREALVEQLRATGDELVRTTLDAVPGLSANPALRRAGACGADRRAFRAGLLAGRRAGQSPN